MDNNIKNSKYVEQERRIYSLYVLQNRALPAIADGLKPAARRVLWTARDGKKWKSATLAGATMALHPHGAPESAINTLAATYGNNHPLLEALSPFGTFTAPNSYGASRYTFTKLSEFCKDVLFKDVEIIPMVKNYDETIDEPEFFLPLIPLVLLNPSDGIAVGFSTTILPRSLEDIISEQIKVLTQKKPRLEDKPITFLPTNSKSIKNEDNAWYFKGSCKIIGTTQVNITALPYGVTHEKFIADLIKLSEKDDRILGYEDNSTNKIDITVKFSRGYLNDMTEDQVYSLFGLNNKIVENINVLDFDCKSVLNCNFKLIIEVFTLWRLEWYVKRYERLKQIEMEDIQKYKDILLAIKKNIGGSAKTFTSKQQLCDHLKDMGIVNIEYIASLPIYRFTEEEKKKVEEKLKESQERMEDYKQILKDEELRKEIYVLELKEILSKYKKKA